MATLNAFLRNQGYKPSALMLSHTQHLIINATINDVTDAFILDTGASFTCVATDKKEYFNMIDEESEYKASGAGSTGIKTRLSHFNSLKVGQWKIKEFPILLIDLSHVNDALVQHGASPVAGILGADLLKKGAGVIDYKKLKLYLK